MSELEIIKKWDLELIPELVRNVFRQILEREVKPLEMLEWGFKLNRGETSVRAMIKGVSLTEEHEDRFIRPFSEDIAIKNCFNHLLGRDPTPEEVETWVEVSLDEGIDDVIKSLITSDEYDEKFGDDGMAYISQTINSGDIICLRANNNLYVCADYGNGSELVANRWKPLGWETFMIENVSSESREIMDGDLIYLRASNGRYLNIKEGDMRDIIATGWTHENAETFTIGKPTEGGKLKDNDIVWLRSSDGTYISIDSSEEHLCAKETQISGTAQFLMRIQQLR
ncbi:MAG: phycobilisome rod-core linker polypeptide [Candidatus Lokiarchaeota archaeon]